MDNLTGIQITTWIISLLISGLMGALLKAGIDEWKSRRQPVGFRVESESIAGPAPQDAGLHAQVSILHNNDAYDLSNLHLVRVEIVNAGNKDLSDITIGVELAEEQECLFAEAKGADHLHVVTVPNPPTPDDRKGQIDFRFQPFNRSDTSKLNLYLELPDGHTKPRPIEFSSPAPVRFAPMPTLTETILHFAASRVLELGPFSIAIRK